MVESKAVYWESGQASGFSVTLYTRPRGRTDRLDLDDHEKNVIGRSMPKNSKTCQCPTLVIETQSCTALVSLPAGIFDTELIDTDTSDLVQKTGVFIRRECLRVGLLRALTVH